MFNQMPYMMTSPMFSQASPFASSLSGFSSPVGTSLSSGAKATGLLGKINWSSILSNAGKALNVANQAIPLYYQVKPVISNFKTLGRIGKELTKIGTTSINNTPSDAPSFDDNNVSGNTTFNNFDAESSSSEIPTPTFFL